MDMAMGEHRSFFQGATMVRLHAACMIVAWLLLLNLGSFFARYLKRPPNEAYVWYSYHMWAQVAGTVLAFVGFGCVFLHLASNDEEHFEGAHQGLGGILLLALAFQPVLGYLAHRSYVKFGISPSRWHVVHWWLGRGLLVLAIATMGLGIDMFFHHVVHDAEGRYRPFFWLCYVLIIGSGAGGVAFLEGHRVGGEDAAAAIEARAAAAGEEMADVASAPGDTVPASARPWLRWWVVGGYGALVITLCVPMLSTALLG